MTHFALTFALLLAAPAAPADEVNALGLHSGARLLDPEGELAGDTAAEALLDGDPVSAWEPGTDVPKTAIFQLAEPYDLSGGEAVNSHNEEGWPGLSVKQLKIEVAAALAGPWQPFATVGLDKGQAPRRFKGAAKAARYVRVTLLSNFGNEEWYGLNELALFGRRSAPRPVDFNGTWTTNYGEMRLTQTGQRIWGCYGAEGSRAGNATVDGAVEGSLFAGSWREFDGETTTEGLMIFALTKEGGLSGVWGRGSDPKERRSRWDGTRKSGTTITCVPPEKSLGRELATAGRVVLRGILFDTGKDVIRAESKPVLEALAAAMVAAPGKTYVIEGHTDDRGGKELNQGLSEKRAASVKAWLQKAGVKAPLKAVGVGMSRPAAPNTTEGGRAANRRVEVATEG